MKPGSTLLEERVTLYNRSDVRHRYYWWNNAGVEVWDDSRIEYPMRFVASHGYTHVFRWPVDPEGKDLSLIKNQTDGPVSFFVHGSHEPFMGIWNPKTQTGTVHYAEYQDLPAKKIWSWGVDAAGLDWRTALSDNKSAYVEVQAGLFRNQETYSFLEPGQTIRFSEFWMPARATGGISRANKAGVVHFETHGSDVTVAMNVNERHQGAQLSLKQDGVVLWSGTADLTPEQTWSHTVFAKNVAAKVTFECKDATDHLLLKQTDGEYDWDPESAIKTGPQDAVSIPAPESRSEDDWLQMGEDQERNGEAVLAHGTYERALEKYPQSQSLRVAAGRLAASLQRFDEAERLLLPAQKRATPSSEIASYLGIAEEGLGHIREAQTSYEIAYRQADLRGAAAIKLADLKTREGDLQAASTLLKVAVAAEPANFRAREQLEAVLRAKGELPEADQLANILLREDPTSDFIKVDVGKPDKQHLAADPNRVLRIAAEYMLLGFYRKALDVLDPVYPAVPSDQSEPGSVLPQKHPLVLYYAAYCRQKLGSDAQQNWHAASELSPSFIFPSSETDRVVLEAALASDSNDAAAHYLLGTLLFSKGLSDEGIAHWTRAKQLAPHLQVVDADLGEAWLRVKNDPDQALQSFREGMIDDPKNAEVYVGLDEAMSVRGVSAAERAATLARYPAADAPSSTMPASLTYQLALTRAEAGEYEQALALFKDRFFPSEEGGVTSGQVEFEIKLMQAEAWAHKHDCTAAEGFLQSQQQATSKDNSARVYVKLARIADSCGHAKESEDLLQKAAADGDADDLVWAFQAKSMLGAHDPGSVDQRMTKSLQAAESHQKSGSPSGSWWYHVGLLQAALKRNKSARESFDNALVLPDTHMSHHLARQALAEMESGK